MSALVLALLLNSVANAATSLDAFSKFSNETNQFKVDLYSVPEQFNETRVYEKSKKLQSFISRYSKWEIAGDSASIILTQFDRSKYSQYYFKKNNGRFSLISIDISFAKKFYYDPYGHSSCTPPPIPNIKINKCECNPKSFVQAESYLQNEGRRAHINNCLNDYGVQIPDNFDQSKINCDANEPASFYDPHLDKIVMGKNFIATEGDSSGKEGARILLHEIFHQQNPNFRKIPYCGSQNNPNLENGVEAQINLVVDGCISDGSKNSPKEGNLNLINQINFRLNDKKLNWNFELASLKNKGQNYTSAEMNFILKTILANLDKFDETVLNSSGAETDKCNAKMTQILGPVCRFEGCPFVKQGDSGHKFLQAISPDSSVIQTNSKITADAKSSAPILIQPLHGDLSNAENVQRQLDQMVPVSGSAQRLANDVTSAAKGLVPGFDPDVPGDYAVSPQIAERISLVTNGETVNSNGSPVSSLSAWNWKVVTTVVGSGLVGNVAKAATTTEPVIADVNTKIKLNAAAKSSSSKASVGSGNDGTATGPSVILNSVAAPPSANVTRGGRSPSSVASAPAASVDIHRDPVGHVNQIVSQYRTSQDILSKLKSEEPSMVSAGVQVNFQGQRVGSSKPRHTLVWKNGQFVEY